jgi:hypothetical protein
MVIHHPMTLCEDTTKRIAIRLTLRRSGTNSLVTLVAYDYDKVLSNHMMAINTVCSVSVTAWLALHT